jgi:hypothetical protein
MRLTSRRMSARCATVVALFLVAGCSSSDKADGPPQFAELMPAPVMQAAAPPPAPVAAAPVQPMAGPPPPPTGPIFGGHLASYTREQDALNGWNVIVKSQSSIGSLKRHLVPAQTPRGPMIRLIAGDFPSAEEANRFCAWAKQQNLYCAVMQLGADAATAAPMPMTAPAPARARRNRG